MAGTIYVSINSVWMIETGLPVSDGYPDAEVLFEKIIKECELTLCDEEIYITTVAEFADLQFDLLNLFSYIVYNNVDPSYTNINTIIDAKLYSYKCSFKQLHTSIGEIVRKCC